MSKKKNKFWTFKLKRRTLSSGVRADHSPKPFISPDLPRPEENVVLESFGASSLSSSATSSPPQVMSTARRAMGAGPSPSSLAAELRQVVPPPVLSQSNISNLLQMVPISPRGADASGEVSNVTTMSSNNLPPLPLPPARPNRDDVTEDQARIVQRTKDIELGIEIGRAHHSAYPHFQYPSARNSLSTSSSSTSDSLWSLSCAFQSQCSTAAPRYPPPPLPSSSAASADHQGTMSLTTFGHGRAMDAPSGSTVMGGLPPPPGPCIPRTEYTQVDYIHCLVPDLHVIANCSFYWGVMDRYEAESLLDNRPEGTFLLRDSAQDDFLFSVSFRRYSRSLHARIDQWNHKFSFDTHDPGVFSADTVTGLIEHYKDPNYCMFFEPMLTRPLCRNFPFSLQHLCRSVICGMSTYDSVNCLPLPKSLVEYLKYYHYKQKVRVRKLQVPL